MKGVAGVKAYPELISTLSFCGSGCTYVVNVLTVVVSGKEVEPVKVVTVVKGLKG